MAEGHGAPAYLPGSRVIEYRLMFALVLIVLVAFALCIGIAILIVRRRRERFLRRHGYRWGTRPNRPSRRK